MMIAFTGHRDYDADQNYQRLYNLVAEIAAVENDVTFLSGMAVGFDLAAAEAIIDLRKIYCTVQLKCVIPFDGQTKYFSEEDRYRYERVLDQADEIETLEYEYSNLVYLRRNDFLVDNADMIIAYYDRSSKGGTAYTIRRARRAKLPIENIYPNQQLSLF